MFKSDCVITPLSSNPQRETGIKIKLSTERNSRVSARIVGRPVVLEESPYAGRNLISNDVSGYELLTVREGKRKH